MKDGQTDAQFLYKTRKKAMGPFKRQLSSSTRATRSSPPQARKLGFLFTELRVNGSKDMVQRYVTPVAVSRPMPESLAVAVPG